MSLRLGSRSNLVLPDVSLSLLAFVTPLLGAMYHSHVTALETYWRSLAMQSCFGHCNLCYPCSLMIV